MKKKSGTKLLVIILAIFVILVGVCAFFLYQSKTSEKDLKEQIAELEWEIESNTQFVYVATNDLTKGTILEEGVNVEIQENVTALPAEFYMQEADLGKTLTVDVQAYEPIMASMLTDEVFTKDTRDYEIGVAHLMVDQQENDYVDIRIMFPNGEDYIVASKLKVKKLLLEDSIFYANLSEAEILTLASATIDAYTISGTKIYLTRYVESNLQEDAIPNYPVREETLALMATDPNILEIAQETLNFEARRALEEKLSGLSEEHLKSVVAGHGIVDTANNSATTDRIAQEQENYDDVVYEEEEGEPATETGETQEGATTSE